MPPNNPLKLSAAGLSRSEDSTAVRSLWNWALASWSPWNIETSPARIPFGAAAGLFIVLCEWPLAVEVYGHELLGRYIPSLLGFIGPDRQGHQI